MPKKSYTPEQIVAKLREIEVLTSQGTGVPAACRAADISDVSYYHWRKEYGGLKLEQARRLKELERENAIHPAHQRHLVFGPVCFDELEDFRF